MINAVITSFRIVIGTALYLAFRHGGKMYFLSFIFLHTFNTKSLKI